MLAGKASRSVVRCGTRRLLCGGFRGGGRKTAFHQERSGVWGEAVGDSWGFRNVLGRVKVASGTDKLMGEFREISAICQDERVMGFMGFGWRV